MFAGDVPGRTVRGPATRSRASTGARVENNR